MLLSNAAASFSVNSATTWLKVRAVESLHRRMAEETPPSHATYPDVSAQHGLDLLLLKAALDDQLVGAVHGAGRTQLGKQEVEQVLRLPVQPGETASDGTVRRAWGQGERGRENLARQPVTGRSDERGDRARGRGKGEGEGEGEGERERERVRER